MAAIEVVLSPESVEPAARNEYWRESARPIFDIAGRDGQYDPAVLGEIRSRSSGEILLARSTFSEQMFMRSEKKIQISHLSGYMLQLLTAGETRGDLGKHNVHFQPGDIFILDLDKPCANFANAGSRLAMMMERERLERLVGRSELHGISFRRHLPITRLITNYMTELWSISLGLSPAEGALCVDVIGALVKGGILGETNMSPEEELTYLETLRSRLLDYIDRHLTDPNLNADAVARHFGISRGALYRALEADGGIATVIRERRLNGAFARLVRDGGIQISQIAYAYGFSSPQQFFKAFQRKFGFSPSDARDVDPRHFITPNLGGVVSHFTRTSIRPE